jgi:hypothetical protein
MRLLLINEPFPGFVQYVFKVGVYRQVGVFSEFYLTSGTIQRPLMPGKAIDLGVKNPNLPQTGFSKPLLACKPVAPVAR